MRSELPGGGGGMARGSNLRTFFSMETRLTKLFVPLHAFLPQMLLKSSYGPVRQIGKGCHVIRYSGGGETQFNFGDLLHGNEAG